MFFSLMLCYAFKGPSKVLLTIFTDAEEPVKVLELFEGSSRALAKKPFMILLRTSFSEIEKMLD